MKRSHPSDMLLGAYARGEMPTTPAVTVSAHIETCADCRAQVEAFELAEGLSLEATPPAMMQPASLGRALEALDLEPDARPPKISAPTLRYGIRLPFAVARAGLGRRRWLWPGLWAAPVRAQRTLGWRTFLLRAPAGVTIPMHEHRGGELIAVLSGALTDGHELHAGDFTEAVKGSRHRLKVADDGPCVCLMSVQGPVRWRGWAKLITPLLGI